MANWNLPTATSGYLDFVTEMNSKFIDAATLQLGSPINLPESTIRYNRSINLFQEWVAGNWVNKVLGIAGGGTGSTTQAGIISNLGLGSMSTQNNNAVNITGGSISGVNLDAGSITGGIVALARGGTGQSLVLGSEGTVLMSHSGIVQFTSGAFISELNAGAMIYGVLPDARLSANVPRTNLANQFTQRQRINNSGGDWPRLTLSNMVGATDAKIWEINIIGSEALNFWALNDSESSIMAAISFHRDGSITGINTINAASLGATPINAGYIQAGTVPIAALGTSGSRDTSTFLRGDNTWAVPPTGSGGGTPIPTGMIGMFDTNCPAGWTRFTQMDGRFPTGLSSPGGTGGSGSHSHSFGGNTDGGGSHSHGFSGSGGLSGARTQGNVLGSTAGFSGGGVQTADAGESFQVLSPAAHTHGVNITIDIPVNGGSVSISGSTDGVGNHQHTFGGATDAKDNYPPYYTLVFCRKD